MAVGDDRKEEWLHGIQEIIEAYAEAKAERVYLEHFRKSKKAMLMSQAEEEDPQRYKSAAAQEVYAYQHPEYQILLDGLKAATETEERLRWRLKQREWKFEQYRTECANARTERSRYGA